MPNVGLLSESSPVPQVEKRPAHHWKVFLSAIAAIGSAFALIALSYYTTFSTIRCYDDEGYMLIQIRHFFNGWPLYDDIVTLYGPMYFLMARLSFGVLPVGHDAIRLLTIGSLAVTAILCGFCVLGLTRRPSLAISAGILAGLRIVPPFAHEPGHPQIVVAMLLAAIAASIAWWNPRRPMVMAGIVGVLVGALLMTKINIGAYAALSILMAFVLVSDESKWYVRPLETILILIFVCLPFALIKSRLTTGRGALQAMFYATAIVAVVMTAVSSSRRTSGQKLGTLPLLSYALGGFLAVIALCVFAVKHGSTPVGIVNGIMLMPLRMAGVFGQGPLVRDSFPEAVASFMLAAAYCYCARRGWQIPTVVTVLLKLVFALTVIAAALGLEWSIYKRGWGVSVVGWGLFLWIFLVRLPRTDGQVEPIGDQGHIGLPRIGLALLAALQPLQSYPVSGSQVQVGTLLMIPAAVTSLAEVLVWAERTTVRSKLAIPLLRSVRFVAVFVLILFVSLSAARKRSGYERLVPLGLTESSRVRGTERQVAGIRWLAANVEQSCTTFLASTGFNSLYLWADREPASRVVIPNQVYMFSESQQRVLLETLEASPKPLVLYHTNFFLTPGEAETYPKNLLLDGMAHDFAPYGPGTVEGYTLRYMTGKPAPEMVEYAAWKGPEVGPSRSAELDILPKPGKTLDRIQVVVIGGESITAFYTPSKPDVIVADSAAASSVNHLEAFSETGEKLKLPLSLDVRRRIRIQFPVSAGISWKPLVVARLLDTDAE